MKAGHPDDEPPTDEQLRKAVYELVGYRKGRALKVTEEAIHDGVAKGCLRWYYVVTPTEFALDGRTRKPTAWERTLVLERKYLPREQGVTTAWNEWCVRWGLPMMQVFTPAQKQERQEKGLPLSFEEVADPTRPEPRYVPGAAGEPEVERAIVAAAAEYDLDLGEPESAPAPTRCNFCSAAANEPCDSECRCIECKKVRRMEAAAALERSMNAPVSGAPVREKRFWEE